MEVVRYGVLSLMTMEVSDLVKSPLQAKAQVRCSVKEPRAWASHVKS